MYVSTICLTKSMLLPMRKSFLDDLRRSGQCKGARREGDKEGERRRKRGEGEFPTDLIASLRDLRGAKLESVLARR